MFVRICKINLIYVMSFVNYFLFITCRCCSTKRKIKPTYLYEYLLNFKDSGVLRSMQAFEVLVTFPSERDARKQAPAFRDAIEACKLKNVAEIEGRYSTAY